jgi:hypothetical protein
MLIRPEQIRMLPGDRIGVANGSAVVATVIEHVYYGSDTVVRLSLRSPSGTIVTVRASGQEVPSAGETVELSVRGEVVIFPAPASHDPYVAPGDLSNPPTSELEAGHL